MLSGQLYYYDNHSWFIQLLCYYIIIRFISILWYCSWYDSFQPNDTIDLLIHLIIMMQYEYLIHLATMILYEWLIHLTTIIPIWFICILWCCSWYDSFIFFGTIVFIDWQLLYVIHWYCMSHCNVMILLPLSIIHSSFLVP